MSILRALQDSLQQVLNGITCGGIDPLALLLAAAPPPPLEAYSIPVLNRFLPPLDCPNAPLPEPPPFTGGQCYGTNYYLDINLQNFNGQTQIVPEVAFQGRLVGARAFWQGLGPLFPEPYLGLEFFYQPNPGDELLRQAITPQNFQPDFSRAGRAWVSNVRTQDGSPDTCGNPPGMIPPIAITPPVPGIRFPPFTINIPRLGPVVFNGTLTINPSVNIPIYGGIHLPITFSFAPNVLVNVPFTVPVYVRFPSLEINPDISFDNSVDITNEVNFPGPGGGSGGCDCVDVREVVREELDDKFPPARPNSSRFEVYESAQARLIDLPQFSEWVQLNLVDVPSNAKRQPGINAPDVVYAGWYSFGINGAAGDRLPIHYESQTVKVPEGATTFSYTVYTGFSATLSIRYREVT